MKYARLLLVFLTMIVCLVLFSGQASAFDLRDVQPPASADKVVYGHSGAGRELITDYGWTVYVLPCMNPDGLMDGYTCNGPGRCTTTYLDANGQLVRGKGVDLNRCFPHNWTKHTADRNFNGSKPLAAREAVALANFIRSVKGKGANVCIDAHGWFQQIKTSDGKNGHLNQVFSSRFPRNAYSSCANSLGFFTSYAASIGYASCLFEFPYDIYSMSAFLRSGYCESFNLCMLDLLKAYGSYNGHSHNCPSAKFDDVIPWRWYHASLDRAINEGIFQGVDQTRFAPDQTMTRAMFVTTLYRIANSKSALLCIETGKQPRRTNEEESDTDILPELEYHAENMDVPLGFTDVKTGAWYETAVRWAVENGIVSGYPDGRFAPNDPLTREQLATILYRYAAHQGRDTTATTSLDTFYDAYTVTSYAKEPMRWAFGNGLIQGVSDSGWLSLQPNAPATRAQAAAIIMRYRQTENKEDTLKTSDME